MTAADPEPVVAEAARRTALTIVVPEAERVVASFRARYATESVAKRIPAHVTVLFPFVPAERVDSEAVAAADRHFGSLRSFDATLVRVGRFSEHVWLAPEPRDVFVKLIRETCRRFPEHAPYDGLFTEPEPHLTVGQAGPGAPVSEIARAAELQLAPQLPVAFRVDAVWLLAEQNDGTWVAAERFPFGA